MEKSAQLRFLLLLTAAIAAAWHPLLLTYRLALSKDAYTQILLILPLSLVLIYSDWKPPLIDQRSGIVVGSVAMFFAALVAALCTWQGTALADDVRLAFQMLAFVLWSIGAFTFCFGQRAARGAIFPLCFLLWMVPLPSSVVNHVVRWLQNGSAFAATTLFSTAGVPVAQDGLKLSIPGLTIEVAKECSSIRSSLMLLMTTMVLAQLLLRSPWRKLFVIAAAVPLSVAKNGLRIFTITMLGTRVDPGFLTGKLHHQGGVVFFAVALLSIFFLLWILRRPEERSSQSGALAQAGSSPA
ncbi:MAG TPA: exosortase/archaeosortase family protein [Terriglobales bacterium]